MAKYDFPPYYISAYGLAVRQGFEGTLDEWLATLGGVPGDRVEMRSVAGTIQWRNVAHDGTKAGPWQDLLTLTEAGPLSREDLKQLIREYLTENPVDGDDGYTPVKGVDYFTEAEIQEIIDRVLAALPIVVSEDGYTDILGLRQLTGLSFVRSGQIITVDVSLEGNQTNQIIITLDSNDYPVTITAGGVEAPVTWEGI